MVSSCVSIVLAYIALITMNTTVGYQFFPRRSFNDVSTVVFCTKLMAKHLLRSERRTDVLYAKPVGDIENDIIKAFSKEQPTMIFENYTVVDEMPTPNYIIIEHGRLEHSREMLLNNVASHLLEYLFVTTAEQRIVESFAKDVLKEGFHYVAYLVFKDQNVGTIVRAFETEDNVTVESVANCTKDFNNVDSVIGNFNDPRHFCPVQGCVVNYTGIINAAMRFWRKEDTIKQTQKKTQLKFGAMIMKEFGEYYNITINANKIGNVSWSDTYEKLTNREIHLAAGSKPENMQMMDNLEVVCWYMFRDMVLTGRMHMKSTQNDIMKMLMPFHYFVWISVIFMTLVYFLLLLVLRKFSRMGLIKEQVQLSCILAISLARSVAVPKNYGLRLVLLIWIVFSFYVNVTYNSTFTSSLAQRDVEEILRNLEEVRDSGQPLGGPNILRSYFNDSQDRFIRDLYERYEVMHPEQAFDSIFNRKAIAILQQFTVDRLNWNQRRNRSQRLYTLPAPIFRIPLFFFSRRAYSFRRLLRRFITNYRETGMLNKLLGSTLIEEDKQIATSQETDQILTIKQLRPIFEIFLMCQGIACLTFIIELLIVHYFGVIFES